MTQLSEIQSIAQQVAEAISAALKIETEIVDETMTVYAYFNIKIDRIPVEESLGKKKC
ncbi:hypothetical protein RRV45_04340 [Bacillus sp. DTU_2020_1000418_1_SI_GHA_SEK_038]|uniref:hypothetical protein n=1 Tax=Bacillus sp. DTU_2020_1000418_1_SI_GHA_SEK_038 TaxID=3077585 RepID=UPI0028E7C6A4|nr:hypothetical protein [Bacillus sp. DTU_2020_1000418_1_SI_GHA_SEK_038]WNS76243.1 hypothetical protein RRV45_04340 [Bacillus sp. DTU_2020_1000418_1_SI_GHA_SEK_038]